MLGMVCVLSIFLLHIRKYIGGREAKGFICQTFARAVRSFCLQADNILMQSNGMWLIVPSINILK